MSNIKATSLPLKRQEIREKSNNYTQPKDKLVHRNQIIRHNQKIN